MRMAPSVEAGRAASGRFAGRGDVCGRSPSNSQDGWVPLGRLGRRMATPRSNPLTQQAASRRGASVLVPPVRHRAVLSSGLSLLDAIRVQRRQSGVIGPHYPGLFDREVTVLRAVLGSVHLRTPGFRWVGDLLAFSYKT